MAMTAQALIDQWRLHPSPEVGSCANQLAGWLRTQLQLETCICAAIRLPDGEVFRGHRHDDAIQTASKARIGRDAIAEAEQGFITSQHRFVSREEGARLQREAGIPSATTGRLPVPPLFSEDLYLRQTNGVPLPTASRGGGDTRPPLDQERQTLARGGNQAGFETVVPHRKAGDK